MSATPVLQVRDLRVEIGLGSRSIQPVDGVSFDIAAGRTLALVGESGSGKSLTCLSLMRVLPPGARVVGGSALFRGEDLVTCDEARLAALRGRAIGMVLQDPMTSVNPLMRAGAQVGEVFRYHTASRRRGDWWRDAVAAMARVRIPAAADRAHQYPHQFSGGMRQRLAIAMAIAGQPTLLIADEPTTALDVTIRLQIILLLQHIQTETGMTMLFVTHDLHLVSWFCDDIAVMYAGRIIEQGPVAEIFAAPAHPYTAALIAAAPSVHRRGARLASIEGQPPSFADLPAGCRFAPRCTRAFDACHLHTPPVEMFSAGRSAACFRRLATP